MIDIEETADAVELFEHAAMAASCLSRASSGHGFIVPEDEVVASTRKGKQVLNVGAGDEAAICAPAEGDSVAVIGENRKLLLFPLKELPEMPRGKGVRLQRYKDGGLADAKTFSKKEGLTYIDSARPQLHSHRSARLVGRARPGRPPAAKGLPQVRQIRREVLGNAATFLVMPGLVPGIHEFRRLKDVDGRDKPRQ